MTGKVVLFAANARMSVRVRGNKSYINYYNTIPRALQDQKTSFRHFFAKKLTDKRSRRARSGRAEKIPAANGGIFHFRAKPRTLPATHKCVIDVIDGLSAMQLLPATRFGTGNKKQSLTRFAGAPFTQGGLTRCGE